MSEFPPLLARDFFLRNSFQNHAIIDPASGAATAFDDYDWQWNAGNAFTATSLGGDFDLQKIVKDDFGDGQIPSNLILLFDENFSASLGFNEIHDELRNAIILEAIEISNNKHGVDDATYQNVLEEIPQIIERYDTTADGNPGNVADDSFPNFLELPQNPDLPNIDFRLRDDFLRDAFSEKFSNNNWQWSGSLSQTTLDNSAITLDSPFYPDDNDLGKVATNQLSLIELIEENFNIELDPLIIHQISNEAKVIAESKHGKENMTFRDILLEVPDILERYDNNQIDGDYGNITNDTTMTFFLNGFLRNLPLFSTTGQQ